MQGVVNREAVKREEIEASMVKRGASRSPEGNRLSYAKVKDTETKVKDGEGKVKNTDTKDRHIDSDLSESDDGKNKGVENIVKNQNPAMDHDNFELKCFKCDKACNKAPNLRKHILSHYYKVFLAVLPPSKPPKCPDCGYKCRDKITLVRHYALTHDHLFKMTDVTPEQAQYTTEGKGRKRRSKGDLLFSLSSVSSVQILNLPILSYSNCSLSFFFSIGEQKKTSLEKSETASKKTLSTNDLCGAVEDFSPASAGMSHNADDRPLVSERQTHVIMSQESGDMCCADVASPQQVTWIHAHG